MRVAVVTPKSRAGRRHLSLQRHGLRHGAVPAATHVVVCMGDPDRR